jgi:glycosyltransferase involved in cell wall biosynthesis
MRILILSQSFPNRRYPIDSEFLAALAAAWAGMGHQVRVLTVRYERIPADAASGPRGVRRGGGRGVSRDVLDSTFEERPSDPSRAGEARFQVVRFPFGRPRYEEQSGRFESVRYVAEFLAKGYFHLRRQIVEFRPEVIDFEFAVPGALLSVPLRGLIRRRQIRTLVRVHGSDYRVPRSVPVLGVPVLRHVLDGFETIHLATADLIDMARSDGLSSELVLNFPGVSIDLCKPDARLRAAKRAELGLEDKYALLTVGRCIAVKEQHLILRALPALREQIPEVHFVLAGDGPELPHLRRLAAELGIEDTVTFMGAVPYKQLGEVYNAGDMFVAPHYGEWFASQTILEAAACGLPVVANFRPHYLEPYGLAQGVHLARFGAEDASDLARQVLHLYRHRDQAMRMARAMMSHVRARFGVSQMARAYLEAAR